MTIDFTKRSTVDLALNAMVTSHSSLKKSIDQLQSIKGNQAVRDAVDHILSAIEIISQEHKNILLQDVMVNKGL